MEEAWDGRKISHPLCMGGRPAPHAELMGHHSGAGSQLLAEDRPDARVARSADHGERQSTSLTLVAIAPGDLGLREELLAHERWLPGPDRLGRLHASREIPVVILERAR